MAQHKYGAGQKVRFTPDRNTDAGSRGAYTIVKTLPKSGGILSIASKRKSMGENASFEKISLIGLRRENASPR